MSSPSDLEISPELQAKIEKKQKERQEQFKTLKEKHVLNDKVKNILKLSVLELQEKLQSRKLTAKEVLEAYIAKALEVNEKFNSITEFIPHSIEVAEALDKEPTTSGRPLHGLPIAIKDDHDVKGMDSTYGFAKNLYKPASENAVQVKILLKLGAVPFCKTNIPQSMCSIGSDNPIFGTTLNSLNAKLSPGGSSSGSASLVAAGGATFATGSDLGGSLRIPAHNHGLSSLRPTSNRLSVKGVASKLPEVVAIPGVPGVIAPDAETLTLIWRALTENNIQNKFDANAVPLPWNENLFASKEKLRVGYFTSLSYGPAFEDTKKTVLAAKLALESKGHKLVEFKMPDDFHYSKIINNVTMPDLALCFPKLFAGEPISECISGLAEPIRNPEMAAVVASVADEMTERMRISMGIYSLGVKSVFDYLENSAEKDKIKAEILRRMAEKEVDLLLMPAFPHPAVKVENGHDAVLPGLAYTMIWNLVDFPAGVVKFGKHSGEDVSSYDDQEDPLLQMTKMALSDSKDMPINVQIVGTPFKEEMVLRAMVELEKLRK